ncbi:MAG: GNAT family N-acetyltransferase [Propionibacteriaceae bacterium]
MDVSRRPNPGERCVIRYRLPDGSATDVIGELVDVDEQRLAISPRPRELVAIQRRDVIMIKVVPEIPRGRAPARTSPAELEQIAALGWVDRYEPLGGWWLRAAGGFTGRANSACAVGDPGLPLTAAARVVIDFAAAHGIRPLAQVVLGSAEDTGLTSLGWHETHATTDVLVLRLSELVGTRSADPAVEVDEHLDEAWLTAFRRCRPFEADETVVRRILAGQGSTVGLGTIRAGDHVQDRGPEPRISIGRAHVTNGWVGVTALWTDPRRRGEGHATALLVALGRWAARRGARNAYLQVAQRNVDARQAYGRLGFVPHHTYRYLSPPTS